MAWVKALAGLSGAVDGDALGRHSPPWRRLRRASALPHHGRMPQGENLDPCWVEQRRRFGVAPLLEGVASEISSFACILAVWSSVAGVCTRVVGWWGFRCFLPAILNVLYLPETKTPWWMLAVVASL
jgi:hypothetical protein